MTIISAAFLLFMIMDPLGNIPIFLSVLQDVKPERQRPVLLRELLLALGVLLLFLYLGQYILSFLNIRQESISIAGGIILFIIAIRMIFPGRGSVMGEQPGGEPFLVPLAIPLIAGPSALATLTLLAQAEPDRLLDWTLAVGIAWGVTAVILLSSKFLYRVVGLRGLIGLERLMGMLLVALSVQMLLDGIAAYLA